MFQVLGFLRSSPLLLLLLVICFVFPKMRETVGRTAATLLSKEGKKGEGKQATKEKGKLGRRRNTCYSKWDSFWTWPDAVLNQSQKKLQFHINLVTKTMSPHIKLTTNTCFLLHWETSCHANMVQCPTQPIFIHSCISSSETFPISCRGIVRYLVHEKFTQFVFGRRFTAFLWWWRVVGRGRRRRWGCSGCRRSRFRPRHYFGFKPHVGKHLTDTFFYLRVKVAISYHNFK